MPVYMARNEVDGLVKIGWSKNVANRLRQPIALTDNARLTIIRLIEAPRWVEPWLHRQFAVKRREGEWFEYDEKMLVIQPPEAPPTPQRPPPRAGFTMWFSEEESSLVLALVEAEDRPVSRIFARALERYAEGSPEYQASVVAAFARPIRALRKRATAQ